MADFVQRLVDLVQSRHARFTASFLGQLKRWPVWTAAQAVKASFRYRRHTLRQRRTRFEQLEPRFAPAILPIVPPLSVCEAGWNEQGVFGFDSRIPLPADQLRNPVNSLGALAAHPAVGMVINDRNHDRTLDPNTEGWGTAFLIGPNLALTAAHVVFQRDANDMVVKNVNPRDMIIRFGWDGTRAHVGIAGVTKWFIPGEFGNAKGTNKTIDPSIQQYDYALLVLDQNIGFAAQSWFVPIANNNSSFITSVENVLVSGHPGDPEDQPKWGPQGYPQVITSGPVTKVNGVNGVLRSVPCDIATSYNPIYVFNEQRQGESYANWWARTQRNRETSGIDSYKGMSGGPLWTFNVHNEEIRQQYNIPYREDRYLVFGLVSSGGSSGNYFTQVSSRMISDLNQWTNRVSAAVHFALDPTTDVEALPMVAEASALVSSVAPPYIPPLISSDDNGRLNLPYEITLYNRGLRDANAITVGFYASLDEAIDPAVDTHVSSEFIFQIPSNQSHQLKWQLVLPETLPHNVPLHIGWIIKSAVEGEEVADPHADRGIFSNQVVINERPVLEVDPVWKDESPPLLYPRGQHPAIELLVSDPDHDVSELRLEARKFVWAGGNLIGIETVPYVRFEGDGATRAMIIDAPDSTESVEFFPVLLDSAGSEHVGDYVFFRVEPTPSNWPPFIEHVGPMTTPEHVAIQRTFNVSDLDEGDSFTFEIVSGPEGATIDSRTGALSWVPGETHGGNDHAFILRVTDSGTPAQSSETTWTVSVTEMNQAPELILVEPISVKAGEAVQFVVRAVDKDLPSSAVQLAAVNIPGSASFDAGSGAFRWIPAQSDVGEHRVSFSASDGELDDVDNVRITVLPRFAFQNIHNPFDVSNDGHVSPLDALLVINFLNSRGSLSLKDVNSEVEAFWDVTGDDWVSPLDALLVINSLDDGGVSSGEGESFLARPTRDGRLMMERMTLPSFTAAVARRSAASRAKPTCWQPAGN